jgi:hypothetical protein
LLLAFYLYILSISYSLSRRELYGGALSAVPIYPVIILVRHDLPSSAASVAPVQMMMVPVQSDQGVPLSSTADVPPHTMRR